MKVGQRIHCYNVKASNYSSAEGKDIGKTFISNKCIKLLFIPLNHSWDWGKKGGLCYLLEEVTKVGTLVIKSIKVNA
jgi:hypothetical protein